MPRSVPLHPSSPPVPLVPQDALPPHSSTVPHQPCLLLLHPQQSTLTSLEAPVPRVRRRRQSREPPRVSAAGMRHWLGRVDAQRP